jgi:hypothetical protein
VIKSATLTLTLTLTQTIHDGTLRTLPTRKLRDLQGLPVLGDTRRHLQIGIVAPKGAGSSPVGHPLIFPIDKPNRQKTKESRYKRQGLLTPLWHHSGEVREV